MAELVKQDPYRAQVVLAVIAMSSALKTFGKKDDDLVVGYMAGLRSRRFPMELIEPTAEWFCGWSDEMPCPRTFMEKGWDLQERVEVQDRLDYAAELSKKESDAKSAQLLEKYPDIDREFVKSLFGSACRVLTERAPADPETARVESELAKATELGLTPKQHAERGS